MDEDTPVKAESNASDKDQLSQAALFYHEYPRPGKLQITATKPLGNQRDLALAYSPGVAAPCLGNRKRPADRGPLHGSLESRRRDFQRNGRARSGRHWCAWPPSR
jgi:malic enzyme